jgi:hypothetical protein
MTEKSFLFIDFECCDIQISLSGKLIKGTIQCFTADHKMNILMAETILHLVLCSR